MNQRTRIFILVMLISTVMCILATCLLFTFLSKSPQAREKLGVVITVLLLLALARWIAK